MAGARSFHLLSDSPQWDLALLLAPVLEQSELPRPEFCAYPAPQSSQDVGRVYRQAADQGGTVVHALANGDLREAALFFARTLNVPSIDMVGHAVVRLLDLMNIQPETHPEVYRHINEDYFRRIEAIEFAVAHDDGLRPNELHRAEIVLVGVSRTSKTPLSMYLATHGWLVGNVPLVLGIDPPASVYEIDPRKVFALTIRPDRLSLLRQVRVSRLGRMAVDDYADLGYVREDLLHARDIISRGGWSIIDVTSNSIEESAAEIVRRRNEQFGEEDTPTLAHPTARNVAPA